MWPDNETHEDLLGFAIHSKLLASIVTNPEMLPVTVGLFGDWGGGKSSVLKMLQRDLDGNDEFAVIYFNSWVFEGYEDAKCAILTTLLTELRDHRNLGNIIGDEVKALLKRVNWMKFLKVSASAGLAYLTANPLPLLMAGKSIQSEKTLDEEDGEAAGKGSCDQQLGSLLNTTQEAVQNVRTFRLDFQKLIDKTQLKAVVILIDDLDRCSPERFIDNLEAIKLFLNVDRTAFVVATDRRIVENAIRIRYSELFTRERDAATADSLVTDYLEKLIQVPYTLPKLAPHEVRSYLSMLFLKKHLPDETFTDVLAKYNQLLSKDRYASFQIGDELASIEDETAREAITESLRLVDACSDAITDSLKGNPRQIKRFLNAFWLRRELARVANLSHLKNHILIKLMVLEYISGDQFEELYKWHRASSDGRAKPLEELESADTSEAIPEEYERWRTPRLWRWVKAEPNLRAEDLRDYFWVARSAIEETLAGVRLMTQAMRTCAENLLSKIETERKSGVSFFASLSEDEQEGVLGVITRHAMQEVKEDASLRSLIDLAERSHLNAAKSFDRCVNRIDAKKLNPGLGVTLRAFEVESGNRASELIGEVRAGLATTDSQIGRALKQKRKSNK